VAYLLLQLDHVAMPVPGDVGLYDIQTTLPGLVSPTSAGLDALMEFGPDGIEAILQQARSDNALNHKRMEDSVDGTPLPRQTSTVHSS